MSTKLPEMYTETTIQDLPDEMLEKILMFLNLDDRRPALRVCRRWSTLKPFDWSSVRLVVDFAQNCDQEANYHRTLLASSRPYKHLVLYFGNNSSMYDLLVDIVQYFSHKVETLKIITYRLVRSEQMLMEQITVIPKITALCCNLKHLHIGTYQKTFGPYDLKFLPMHKLEELYMENNLLSIIPNMSDIMPNITRLHMKNHYYSVEARIFLCHFSSQLVELNIVFRSKDYFLTVCRMQFPLLEKLNFHCAYVNIDPRHSLEESEMIDLFFLQLPLLKEVTLRCDLDDRVLQNLCRSCVNMQFLCVCMDHLSQDSFRLMSELKHLKHLRIEEAKVNASPDMYSPQTSLRKLTLYFTHIVHHAKFNSFIQRAFPNLAVVELTPDYVSDEGWSFEQICSKLPSLQRLVVSKPDSDIMLDQLLEFCAFQAPKELRLKCRNISDTLENEIHNRIPVQKLVLDSPHISLIVLHKLISSMEELRWLELALPYYYSPEEISTLQKQFPRCYIVVQRTVVIEEPS